MIIWILKPNFVIISNEFNCQILRKVAYVEKSFGRNSIIRWAQARDVIQRSQAVVGKRKKVWATTTQRTFQPSNKSWMFSRNDFCISKEWKFINESGKFTSCPVALTWLNSVHLTSDTSCPIYSLHQSVMDWIMKFNFSLWNVVW